MEKNSKLAQFIQEQVAIMKNPSGAKAKPASKALINPNTPDEPQDEYSYIITKKPAKKRVEKYIQSLIDQIVAEND
jgi:hypothetical protein